MARGSIDVLEPGDPAPPFELTGTDGDTHTLLEYADYDALLVVFTCNHCPYAQAKIPALNRLAADYDDVAVIGINPNDNAEYPEDSYDRMVELVKDGTIEYDAYLYDSDQSVAAAYGAVCTPDPFLFANEDGTFRLAYHGRLDDAPNPNDEPTREEMREAIDAVLSGEEIALPGDPARGCSIKWREGNEPDYWATV